MSGRILYIEDNEQNLYLVTFLLETNGYEVLQAREGQEGIGIAARSSLDLILLDIQLPIMDGYAVARRLRTNSSLGNVPIVALTSFAMAGDRERAIEAGCNGYIEKPINPDTFMAQVVHYLQAVPDRGKIT
ncbi:MAG: response regulator [Candidatus Hydrogenedentes bacterium]|nr:response regulator [Candidatus Hydrogenedentota bacterium]